MGTVVMTMVKIWPSSDHLTWIHHIFQHLAIGALCLGLGWIRPICSGHRISWQCFQVWNLYSWQWKEFLLEWCEILFTLSPLTEWDVTIFSLFGRRHRGLVFLCAYSPAPQNTPRCQIDWNSSKASLLFIFLLCLSIARKNSSFWEHVIIQRLWIIAVAWTWSFFIHHTFQPCHFLWDGNSWLRFAVPLNLPEYCSPLILDMIYMFEHVKNFLKQFN